MALESWTSRDARRDFPQPVWLGDAPVEGRDGAAAQRAGHWATRCCSVGTPGKVAALGARVDSRGTAAARCVCSPSLEGVAEIVATGDPLPAFDYHCPLMSLPLAFRTDLANIPASVPYLRSDPATRCELAGRARPEDAAADGARVERKHGAQERQAQHDAGRRCCRSLRDWAEWVSLQKEVRETDASLLASHAGDSPRRRRVAGLCRHGGAGRADGRRGDDRHQRGQPRRRDGQGRVDYAAVQPSRLALDARSRGQHLVPDRALVSPTRGRTIGRASFAEWTRSWSGRIGTRR